MRRELMELFRDTRADASAGALRPRETPDRSPAHLAGLSSAPEPSRFLRRYLQRSSPTPETARSGLVSLDSRLGGGFGEGLHLVVGTQGAETTAFLESLAWEAVGNRRPTLYYAFKSGGQQVWERLIGTLGAMLYGRGIIPSALRGPDISPSDRETLTRLDAELQASVLPYLSLVDRTPSPSGDLNAFIERLHVRSQEAAEEHGRLPLVLVDDLDELFSLTGSRPSPHLLSRLDSALMAGSQPGVFGAAPDTTLTEDSDGLPVRSLLTLEPAPAGPGNPGGWVDLEVRKNLATGWIGSIPLFLDPLSGLFADAAAAD
jgi:hypothetical protein